MRQRIFTGSTLLFLYMQFVLQPPLRAQQYNCTFKAPLLTIDFGRGRDVEDINRLPLPNYRQVFYTCPIDGHYSYVSHTSGCFEDDWLTFSEDHTLSDKDGNMMLVNANPAGGVFFTTTISGLKGNTAYQIGAWLINVCNLYDNCPPLPPNIVMTLITSEGKIVAIFKTGPLPQGNDVIWRRHTGIFTTPANITT